jgi:signal transduction histidine kinase
VKNPLQYMGTGIELLGSTVRDESAQALVRDLKTGVRTLDAIVKELLDFSRPMTLDLMPVQANDLVREVAARLAEPDVDTVLDLDPSLPEIRLDAYKVRQVLENLVRNSVQALSGRGPGAPRGRIRLATAAVREGPLAGGVSILVEDDGPGIPPDALASIWDPFYTTKTRGSGLGLSVVRRIVDAHGGTVTVRSRPGEGAVFEIVLPPGGGGVA